MAEAVTIDANNFCDHLKSLYTAWETGGSSWGSDDQQSTALAILSGAASGEELRYLKSTSLQLWLFGYELPETVILITKKAFHVLTSAKKASLVAANAEACKERVGVDLVAHVKPKGEDGSIQVAELLEAVRGSGEPPVLGQLQKEKSQEGKVVEVWNAALDAAGVAQVDVARGWSEVLARKDESAITKAKKAAFLAASAMKNFAVPELEKIIDEERKVKHTRFGSRIEEAMTDPDKVKVKLRAENVDISYPPIVQSGGVYDLRASAVNDERVLQYDVVLIAIGARYSLYCANAARTYLVDPSKQQQEQYAALLAAVEAASKALEPGAKCSAAYSAAVQALEAKGHADLAAKLPKSLGWSMGTEIRESHYQITAKNEALIQPGMIFNLSLGVADLERSDAGPDQASKYALLVADTYLVPDQAGKAPECLTANAPRVWSEVAYYFKDQEEEAAAAKPAAAPAAKASSRGAEGTLGAVKNLRSEDNKYQERDEQRRKQKENQEGLLRNANENTLKALRASDGGGRPAAGRKVSAITTYARVADMPSSRELAIQVDLRAEAVLVPIYGLMVPFHILTLKNATSNQDGDHAYIRLNFNFGPGFEPGAKHPAAAFLKELSYRTSDTRHAAKVVQEIKVLRSSVSQREKERAERATLVQQERLIKAKGRVYTLPDVWIRPPFGGKGRKMTGQLEAHANGFRYSSPKGDTLDIMYRNVRHAFFQPAENEMITLVHFRLHNPIMVGKKKTADVQFYAEVMDSVQTIEGGRRSMYDPDELEEEQREREIRNRTNKTFEAFTRHVVRDVWERDFGDLELEWEVPFRDLGFTGVPFRTASFVMPTVNCLVELIEQPFTVITLADVNLVNLERVGFGLRNFDMAIVPKDLTKDVIRIDAIPQQSLDTIREWLTSMGIKYYESKMNLNWKPILKSITEDPDGFVEHGGWNFLDAEGGDDEDGEGEDSEEEDEFRPDSEEEGDAESEDDDDDDEGDSDVDEDEEEDGSEYEEEDSEEEGMSWDELEKEAIREDRRKGEEEGDSDDDRGRKRKSVKGGGGGGGAAVKKARR